MTDETTEEAPETTPAVVRFFKNGPILVTGAASIDFGHDGDYLPIPEKLYLCRCGKSAKKPFCDGSHLAVGFDDSK